MFSKSSVTTLCSILIILSSFIFTQFGELLLSVGLFAVSGSITNWLAIHMLFEKIPFLYGSGVIPRHFEKFKLEIRSLIVSEFFSSEQIRSFLTNSNDFSADKVFQKLNFDFIFDELVRTIEGSKVGSMLQLVGGRKALEPLKQPIVEKLKTVIEKINSTEANNQSSSELIEGLKKSLEELIDSRLSQLSASDVKLIVKKIIKAHLGWLVVWGGIVGGILGFIIEFANFGQF